MPASGPKSGPGTRLNSGGGTAMRRSYIRRARLAITECGVTGLFAIHVSVTLRQRMSVAAQVKLSIVLEAADRASTLTNQLLVFSRNTSS